MFPNREKSAYECRLFCLHLSMAFKKRATHTVSTFIFDISRRASLMIVCRFLQALTSTFNALILPNTSADSGYFVLVKLIEPLSTVLDQEVNVYKNCYTCTSILVL